MPLRAVIQKQAGWDVADWIEVAKFRLMFRLPAEREIINPFTKKPAVVRPEPGEYRIFGSLGSIGVIKPSPEFDDDGELQVFSPEEVSVELKPILQEVADALDATLLWIDEP